MFERFTEPGIKVVVTAQEEARKIGNNFVGTEQILLGLIAETSGIGGRILRKYGVTLRLAREEIKRLVGRGSGFVAVEIPFTPRARRVLENAIEESRSLGFPYVGPEHILLGVLMEDSGIAVTALRKILQEVNPDVTFDIIRRRTLREMGEDFDEEFRRPPSTEEEFTRYMEEKRRQMDQLRNPGQLQQFDPAQIHPYFDPGAPLLLSPVLNEFTQNITQLAFAGQIDPVVGRDVEVERCLQILSRRRKNNPILLGEPGVGKTAVAEGLALQIITGNVPSPLQGKNIITLDLGLIIAGSRYRGDFEKRLKRVIADIQLTQCYILVVDEVHTLVGAGAAEGSLDAANILKPALARGEFQCIGATTISEFRKYIEPDAALARRFQSVMVDEPSVDDTISILGGIRDKYESHHCVQITQDALEEAAILSSRYINDRYLPDKAIDIIDEACSRVRLGYELIPNILTGFEDQLAAICREKDAAYVDKDWKTGLELLREETKIVENFLNIIYDLLAKLREQKKYWVVRSMKQRYQFILKGNEPLLKEWQLVVDIDENEKLIRKLARKNNNSKNKKLPKPADPNKLEETLANYRAEFYQQPVKNFLEEPPVDNLGRPLIYNIVDKPLEKDSPEIKEIKKAIKNEKDPKKKLKLKEDLLRKREGIPDNVTLNSADKSEQFIDEKFDEVTDQKLNETETKLSDNKPLEIKTLLTNVKNGKFDGINQATFSLIQEVNTAAGPIIFQEKLAELDIKTGDKTIPVKIIKAIQNRLFKEAFEVDDESRPVPQPPIVPDGAAIDGQMEDELVAFLEEEHVLDSYVGLPSNQRETLGHPDVRGLKKFRRIRSLWQLHSFIVWNRFVLIAQSNQKLSKNETNSTKDVDIPILNAGRLEKRSILLSPKTTKKRGKASKVNKTNQGEIQTFLDKKGIPFPKLNQNEARFLLSKYLQIPETKVGENQSGIEIHKLYRKYKILKNYKDVNFDATLKLHKKISDNFADRVGNIFVETYGYGFGEKQITGVEYDNLLPERMVTTIKASQTNDLNLNLSEPAKVFLQENPNWFNVSSSPVVDIENFPEQPKQFKVEDFEEILQEGYTAELPEDASYNEVLRLNPVELAIQKQEDINKENTAKLDEISKTILKNNNKEKEYIPWVFASDIAGVVAEWTGVPVTKVSKNETKKLLNIEQELQKRVIGQPDAVEAIAKALRRGRIGLRDLTRPIASFFFSGPTGVGKTEVTKALASSYFGGEEDMIRFDMSEFMERHTVSKLIGSPPGYVGYSEGGQLTEAVRRKPYVVILFDEVEKAHPDVFNLLLQVLEDGRLSDSQGRNVDFKNSIIVMTSNLGAAAIQDPDKFKSKKSGKQDKLSIQGSGLDLDYDNTEKTENEVIKDLVHDELKGFFRPEFLNRIDEIVVFRKLTKPDVKEIASIMLKGLKETQMVLFGSISFSKISAAIRSSRRFVITRLNGRAP